MAKELPNITKIAVALSNHSKMLVLDSLMDKRGHTLLEIAREANIQPQTASYHLQNFINNGWVKMEKSGRFHYFFLVSDQVAALIEQFSPLSPSASTHTLTRALKVDKMRTFRSCYDHMAGKIGVLITDQLLADHLISEEPQAYQVTPDGLNFFEKDLNIDLETVQKRNVSLPLNVWTGANENIISVVPWVMPFLMHFQSKLLLNVIPTPNERFI